MALVITPVTIATQILPILKLIKETCTKTKLAQRQFKLLAEEAEFFREIVVACATDNTPSTAQLSTLTTLAKTIQDCWQFIDQYSSGSSTVNFLRTATSLQEIEQKFDELHGALRKCREQLSLATQLSDSSQWNKDRDADKQVFHSIQSLLGIITEDTKQLAQQTTYLNHGLQILLAEGRSAPNALEALGTALISWNVPKDDHVTELRKARESVAKALSLISEQYFETFKSIHARDPTHVPDEKEFPEFRQYQHELQEALESVVKMSVSVAVVGSMKSGKSTLISSVIGQPVTPSDLLPMTFIPTIIRHAPGVQEPTLFIPAQSAYLKDISMVIAKIRALKALRANPVSPPSATLSPPAPDSPEHSPDFPLSSLSNQLDSSDYSRGSPNLSSPSSQSQPDQGDEEFDAETLETFEKAANALPEAEKMIYRDIEKLQLDFNCAGTERVQQQLKLLNHLCRVLSLLECFDNVAKEVLQRWQVPVINVEFSFIAIAAEKNPDLTNAQFEIIDTPGPDEAHRNSLTQSVKEALRAATTCLCVVNSLSIGSEGSDKVLSMIMSTSHLFIKRRGDIGQNERLYFVANYWDQVKSSKDKPSLINDVDTAITGALHHTALQHQARSNIHRPTIVVASAKHAALSMKMATFLRKNSQTTPRFEDFKSWAEIVLGQRPERWFQTKTTQEFREENGILWDDSGIGDLIESVFVTSSLRLTASRTRVALKKSINIVQEMVATCEARYRLLKASALERERELKRQQEELKRLEAMSVVFDELTKEINDKVEELLLGVRREGLVPWEINDKDSAAQYVIHKKAIQQLVEKHLMYLFDSPPNGVSAVLQNEHLKEFKLKKALKSTSSKVRVLMPSEGSLTSRLSLDQLIAEVIGRFKTAHDTLYVGFNDILRERLEEVIENHNEQVSEQLKKADTRTGDFKLVLSYNGDMLGGIPIPADMKPIMDTGIKHKSGTRSWFFGLFETVQRQGPPIRYLTEVKARMWFEAHTGIFYDVHVNAMVENCKQLFIDKVGEFRVLVSTRKNNLQKDLDRKLNDKAALEFDERQSMEISVLYVDLCRALGALNRLQTALHS